MSPRRRAVVIAALALLVALSLPRYLDRLFAGDYIRAAQMVILVWFGFFLSARYWVKDDARFSRALVAAAAAICIPPLVYHLYDHMRHGWGSDERIGNLVLLVGIGSYSYGALIRGEPFKRPKP
jgi:apolipoprotein N-acyltransferase